MTSIGNTVRSWLNSLPKAPDVLCLQEIKANHFRLEQSLNFIYPNSNQIIAPPISTCGGIALLLSPTLSIISSGTIGQPSSLGYH